MHPKARWHEHALQVDNSLLELESRNVPTYKAQTQQDKDCALQAAAIVCHSEQWQQPTCSPEGRGFNKSITNNNPKWLHAGKGDLHPKGAVSQGNGGWNLL